MSLRVRLTALLTTAVLAGAAGAGDAPFKADWPNFRNGPALTGVTDDKLPDNFELLWEYPTADGSNSTPAIADGRVYVGTLAGDILCLELATGKKIWAHHSIVAKDPNEFAPGFAAPITITPELVLGGDEDGVYHAVDRKTGEGKWTFKTGTIINGGGNIYGDSVLVGSRDGKLYRLKLASGEKMWEFDAGGPVNATPTIAGQYTFMTGCSEPFLLVVDLETGKLHKKVPIDGRIIATAAYKDDLLYFGTAEGKVYALDWQKGEGEAAWTYAMPNQDQQIDSSPAVTDKLVVIGGPGKMLLGLDRKNGQPAWTLASRAKFEGAPVVAGDKVVAGGLDRTLYVLALADGKPIWKYNAGQPFKGSPAVGGGRIVIATESGDGRILCFGAKGGS